MPIYRPGLRTKDNNTTNISRNIAVTLSLTAMADMFTVLTVFLLQNLFVTGEVLELYNDIKLPAAREIKELKPAHVIAVSDTYLMLNGKVIKGFEKIRKNPNIWLIEPLKKELEALIVSSRQERESLAGQVSQKIQENKSGEKERETLKEFRVTLQSDKQVEFGILKKIMYTITQAGVREINFAVVPKKKSPGS